MSTLVGPDLHEAPTGPHELPPSVVGVSLLAAVQAAAASLVLVLVPVVGTWTASTGGASDWPGVVRLGLDLWVLAQHGGIVVSDGHVGLVPLGLSAVPLAACWFAGRRLARALDPRAERIAAGATRAVPSFPPLRALVVFAAGYALLAGVAAVAGATPSAQPILGQAFVGAGTVAGVAGCLGAAAYRFGSAWAGVRAVARLLPPSVRLWLRPAAAALVLHLAASLAVVLALLVMHGDQVSGLQRALQPDAAGGFVLVLAQVTLLPDVVLWAAAVLAGPGFAIGAGTSVTTAGAVLGPLPALPLLGALPGPGAFPASAGLLLSVPVLAGLVSGMLLLRAGDAAWWRLLIDVAGIAAVVGVALTGLAWLSGGPAGPGRLAVTGPVAWQVGAAGALQVAAGTLLAVLVGRGLPFAGRWALDRWRADRGTGGDWVWDDDEDDDA
jgi:hypothetical protein